MLPLSETLAGMKEAGDGWPEDAALAERSQASSDVLFPLADLLPGPHRSPVLSWSSPPCKSTSGFAELTKTINSCCEGHAHSTADAGGAVTKGYGRVGRDAPCLQESPHVPTASDTNYHRFRGNTVSG